MKTIKESILISFLLIFTFAGCSLDRSGTGDIKNEIHSLTDEELDETLSENLELAQTAFFSDLPSLTESIKAETGVDLTTEDGYLDLTPEQVEEIEATFTDEPSIDDLPIREQLDILALDAAATGNYDHLIDFMKENDLYDRFLEINEQYEIDEIQNEMLRREGAGSERYGVMFRSPPEQADDWLWELKTGDILFTHNNKTIYAWLVPGDWDHCGIYDARGWGGRSDLRVFSASAVVEAPGDRRSFYGNPVYACLGYESIYFYSHQPVVEAGRYIGANRVSESSLFRALDKLSQYGGNPYKIGPDKEGNDYWYCSKTVYRVWNELGVNLDKVNFYWFGKPRYGWFVTPGDIKNNDLVTMLPKYENMPRPGAPGFSIEGGSYRNILEVEIAAQNKADIFYTLDGTDPENFGRQYNNQPITIGESSILKAVAVNLQGEVSPIAEAEYLIDDVAGEALLSLKSGDYNSDQIVNVTPDANTIVFYTFTTDGSLPLDPTKEDAICGDQLILAADQGEDILYRYKFRSYTTLPASRSSAEISEVVNRQWRIDKVAPPAPTMNVPSGTYAGDIYLELTGDPGTKIFYTLASGGSATEPIEYRNGFLIKINCLLRAYSVDAAGNESPITYMQYNIDRLFSAFTVSPSSGTYSGIQTVEIEASETAEIHFTVSDDGSIPENPDRNDPVYTGPFPLPSIDGRSIQYIYKFKSYSKLDVSNQLESGIIMYQWVIDNKAPDILSVFPGPDDTTLELDQPIRIEFSEPVDRESVLDVAEACSFRYYDGELPLQVSFSNNDRVVFIQPSRGEFFPAYDWTLDFKGEISDIRGNKVSIQQEFQFKTPVPEDVVGFAQIETDFNGFYIDENGSLWGWGRNGAGLLGIGNNVDQRSPVLIRPFIQKVRVGSSGYSLFLTFDGTLYASGNNNCGQLGDGTFTDKNELVHVLDNIVDMDTGRFFSLALDDQGQVYAFGLNSHGQYGNGSVDGDEIQQIPGRAYPTIIRSGVASVAAGHSTSYILDTEGNVFSAGTNERSALGVAKDYFEQNNSTIFQYVISNVKSLFSVNSGGRCFVITEENELYGWGNTSAGGNIGLGIGRVQQDISSPVLIAENVRTVQANNDTVVFVKTNNDLYIAGGLNAFNQVPPYENDYFPALLHSNVEQVVLGTKTMYIKTTDGSYYSRYSNQYGQIGSGSEADYYKDWYLLRF